MYVCIYIYIYIYLAYYIFNDMISIKNLDLNKRIKIEEKAYKNIIYFLDT